MMVVFSSLRSFCAPRQAPSSVLSMMTALLRSYSVGYLQIIQDAQYGGITDFSFSSQFFYRDTLSRHEWVASNSGRYTTIFEAKVIAAPCGVLVSCSISIPPCVYFFYTAEIFFSYCYIISNYSYFYTIYLILNLFLKFHNKCSHTRNGNKLAEVEEG